MDISRIEAYNPNKINWKNLTAKEILKYQKQGVEVPDVYVQWAQDFLKNIAKYDTDEVTYEKAQSITRHQSNEAKANTNTNNTNVSAESNETGGDNAELPTTTEEIRGENTEVQPNSSDTNSDTSEMTAAQIKRKNFQDTGVSLRQQAITFTQDSQTLGQEAVSTEQIVSAIQNNSDNEIAELEGTMKELLAEAEAKQNELKQEVDKINKDKSDTSTFAKIEKLQKELEQYGVSGQNEASQTESTLRGYSGEIAGGQSVMLNAADFGSETVSVGNELLATSGRSWWFNIDRMIGEKAVDSGNDAVAKAQSGEQAVQSAENENNSNIGKIPSIENQIEEKTGIGAQNKKNQESSSEQDPITGKTEESDKDIKTATNDGTDTTDKLHLSIDELLKRKVRRGEYAQES